jgi:hypothetical protein
LAIIDRILRNPQMSFALIHAGEVQPELRQLGCELTTLARRVNILTTYLDHLVLATMPHVRPVPEGSQELPLDWRGVWAVIGALAALTGLV